MTEFGPTAEELGINNTETEEKKPIFGYRNVVNAMLDGTVPFEGAITRITPTENGFMYTVVEFPDNPEGEQGKTDTVSEESLLKSNEGEMHLWQ